MTKAKLNVQHDYITLRVVFADKTGFNFTRSRYGVKLSGVHATRELLKFLDCWCERERGKVYLKQMEALREIAERSTTIQEFINGVQ